MNQSSCDTCVHYQQHDTFDRCRILRVYCGHCTYHKVKRKNPDAKACEDYQKAAPWENDCATKEYVRKALLEYMLKLDLLPEIQDMEK